MASKKSSRRGAAAAEVEAAPRGRGTKVPAAVAGAARRRKARLRGGDEPRGWARAMTDKRKVAKADVKKVLEKGTSKADQLLESAMKWVVKLAIRAKALYDMLEAWWRGKFDFPTGTLQAIVVALLYFISPLDIIPDVLPFFGLVDDAAILAFVVNRVRGDLDAFAKATGKTPADLGF